MEDPKDARNWMKLKFVADHACTLLRVLFKKTWKETFNSEWDAAQAPVILDHQNLKNITKNQRQMIEEGDIEKWDITLLKTILTTPGLVSVGSEQIANMIKISNIRNELSHHPTKSLSKYQFDVWWKEIQQILVDFGASESELKHLTQECNKGSVEFLPNEEMNEQIQDKALQLKEKGNTFFKNGNFSEAVRLYTEAICLSGLPSAQLATLHANRCVSYLKSHEKQREKNDSLQTDLLLAETDAEKAIELSPDWCKGYFRLGQVHLAMGKFRKSEDSLNEALAREPQNREILHALRNARMKKGQGERMDYVDLRNGPKSMAEFIQEINKKKGSNLNDDSLKNYLTANVDSPEVKNFQDCFIGHCYKRGIDGYPRDHRLAAEHYSKAVKRGSAQAMLNLGSMMLSGKGVEQDFEAGIKLLKEAASQSPTNLHNAVNFGVAESENALALCYEEGFGVAKDLGEAVYWYQRASQHGCSIASNNLGLIYEQGIIDGKPDLLRAEQFYRMAAKSGANPANFAMFNLARLLVLKGDPKRALEWCRRSKEHGNMNPSLDKVMEELEKEIDAAGNIPADGVTTQESRYSLYSAVAPQLAASVANHKIAKIIMENCCLPTIELDNGNTRFTREELIKCSDTSAYGQHLLAAKQHCLAALDILSKIDDLEETPPIAVCEKFIAYFSAGAQIEFMVFELLPQWHRLAISIVNQLLTEKTMFDEDVRVCYVSLQDTSSAQRTISFLNNCIQKYPQNDFFYKKRAQLNAFLQRYEDGVADANTALQLCPTDWDVMFARAEMMHRASPTFPPQALIDAYKQFLELAPQDHWKAPEACYGIAYLIILQAQAYNVQGLNAGKRLESIGVITKVTKYYDLGIAAEKRQLSFFLPYISKIKIKLEETGVLASCLRLTSALKPKNHESHDQEKKLTNPDRIAKITQHRMFLKANHRMDSCARKSCVEVPTLTTPAPIQQKSSEANVNRIYLEDMDPTKNFVYRGCVLDVTVIDEVDLAGSSISLVIEDSKRHVERCFIYNSPLISFESKCRKQFGPGCQMCIINPYMRIAEDGKPAIHVDDHNSIIPLKFVPNMCRYCCKPNATMPCAKCKIALYCNTTCKLLDWEKMQHKLICLLTPTQHFAGMLPTHK